MEWGRGRIFVTWGAVPRVFSRSSGRTARREHDTRARTVRHAPRHTNCWAQWQAHCVSSRTEPQPGFRDGTYGRRVAAPCVHVDTYRYDLVDTRYSTLDTRCFELANLGRMALERAGDGMLILQVLAQDDSEKRTRPTPVATTTYMAGWLDDSVQGWDIN